MQVLFAPWRMAYIGSIKEPGCIFCSKPQDADRRAALVLARSSASAVIMNRYPYGNGHLMVAPLRHTNDLMALPPAEYADLTEIVRRALALMQEFFKPDGINVGMNLGIAAGAGIADHLHWHLVPRWIGDTNFMPLLAETRSIPEHLESLWDRLRPRFATLDA